MMSLSVNEDRKMLKMLNKQGLLSQGVLLSFIDQVFLSQDCLLRITYLSWIDSGKALIYPKYVPFIGNFL